MDGLFLPVSGGINPSSHSLNHISHNFPFSNYGKRVILILEFMPNVPEFMPNVTK